MNVNIPLDLGASGRNRQVGKDAQDEVNPFVCNICKKSYSRIDHLSRHYRSHTNEKPFGCHICLKDFGRADLLKRHVAGHTEDKESRKKQKLEVEKPPTRPRVSQACLACAESKVKCDARRPCGRCQRRQINCEYSKTRKLPFTRNGALDEAIRDDVDISVPFVPSERTSARQEHGQDYNEQDVAAQSFAPMPTPLPFELLNPATVDPGSLQAPQALETMEMDVLPPFDTSSLADFLRDVMMPLSPNDEMHHYMMELPSQTFSPRDVLNFASDINFLSPSFDPSFPTPQADELIHITNANPGPGNTATPAQGDNTKPVVANGSGINLGAQAFRESLWSWTPAQQDHGYSEQLNMSIADEDLYAANVQTASDGRTFGLSVSKGARDRVLAMILTTCEPSRFPKIVTSFPSSELLTNILHTFMIWHASQTDTWFHFPTFRPDIVRPELLAIMVAAGAVLSGISVIRKLGFAMQEGVRLALPEAFERDNRMTRDLQATQTLALQLDIGLWSGDRRKTEIAECFAHTLVTMMRRSGRFRRLKSAFIPPVTGDNTASLETKWRNWIEIESFKRLAFHILIRDAQTSMSLLSTPIISYTEFSTDLPLRRDLWTASTADEWSRIYFRHMSKIDSRAPSLSTCIQDLTPLSKTYQSVDLQLTILIILHGMWTLISEYSQLHMAMKHSSSSGTQWNGGLITTSLYQDISARLSHFVMVVSEWLPEGLPADATLFYENSLLNLHVSFEDLQLFAGKEGEDEARRVFPSLHNWAASKESRQAAWHAGQVLKAAKRYRPRALTNFAAIALYHAALVLWAKAVLETPLTKAFRRTGANSVQGDHRGSVSRRFSTTSTAALGDLQADEKVWLDGEEDSVVQKYLMLGRGTPAIRGLDNFHTDSTTSHQRPSARGVNDPSTSAHHYALISEPRALMDIAIDILRKKSQISVDTTTSRGASTAVVHPARKTWVVPPLIENLSRLMDSLGKAAEGMMTRVQ